MERCGIVSASPYRGGMPASPRPDGQLSAAHARVNKLIRGLMGRPADKQRSAEYERLLIQWAEVSQQEDVEPAA